MAHPPLQPRPRLREADGRDEARDSGGGEGRRRVTSHGEPAGERIELKLRTLSQLFNSFDPSPFRERELDPSAEEFVLDWARELPRDVGLELVVHLSEPPPESDAELTSLVDEAVRHHFGYRAGRSRHELRELLRRGRTSLLIGLGFAGACVAAANALVTGSEATLRAIASESLTIIGWVAMWRPLEIFLYDWWPVRRLELEYARLAQMRTRVVCAGRGARP